MTPTEKAKEQLQKNYEKSCNAYVKEFCKKHDVEFEYWVDSVGGVAMINDYFFNFSDIVWDINSGQPKELIFEWYDECVGVADKSINYYSYTKGLRL